MSAPPGEARILLVEDDPEIASLLCATLADNGFQTTSVASAVDMDRLLEHQAFDLVVLDVMLPGENGLSICRRLRAESRIPILMLTALGESVDRVVGLEIGADDYVAKPFQSRELIARIRALLRRAAYTSPPAPAFGALRFAGWALDPLTRQVTDPDGSLVTLTAAEFDLLLAFCRNPGQVMTREHLLGLTHAGSAGPIQRSVDVHISRIRQKIEPDMRNPTLIKTVRLGGYIFTPRVEVQ
ncbi:response regulator [Marinivivus vitaminiproducens]|uniref:response regulator n=1 Tax=Marinivivus vitaminiproducens TaxID=3035935 RepID=UPI002799988D|nr:response regulator [Geminicoccaceae bacterium SCSIO 64248]